MSDPAHERKSFSLWKRWGFGLDLVVRTVLVLAVVVMVNYLGARWYERFHLGATTQEKLSPLTVGLLESITNEVRVTLLYDRDDALFMMISSLLNEYRDANPRLRLATVDYLRDPAAAEALKRDHKNYFVGVTNRNLIIFDCEGRVKAVNGNALAQYALEPTEMEKGFLRKPIFFLGEKMFTSALLAVINPHPLKAYYLAGHGEHRLDDGGDSGYLSFASILQQNYVQVQPLSLAGTNPVPADCNLLLIAGPTTPIADAELEKIGQYLEQGGRLFALFNASSKNRQTGLEKLLVRYGVMVDEGEIRDPTHSLQGLDVVVGAFSRHPVVNPLLGSGLDLLLPRPVRRLAARENSPGAPTVEVLFASENTAVLAKDPKSKPASYPLAVAVEKGAVRGVVSERGSTRMIVVGDSFFLANGPIELYANRDFAGYAVNWLLERTQLMQGLGPRPVAEFRLAMSRAEFRRVRWILLAGMPGAVLLLGGLVWLRRRS